MPADSPDVSLWEARQVTRPMARPFLADLFNVGRVHREALAPKHRPCLATFSADGGASNFGGCTDDDSSCATSSILDGMQHDGHIPRLGVRALGLEKWSEWLQLSSASTGGPGRRAREQRAQDVGLSEVSGGRKCKMPDRLIRVVAFSRGRCQWTGSSPVDRTRVSSMARYDSKLRNVHLNLGSDRRCWS